MSFLFLHSVDSAQQLDRILTTFWIHERTVSSITASVIKAISTLVETYVPGDGIQSISHLPNAGDILNASNPGAWKT